MTTTATIKKINYQHKELLDFETDDGRNLLYFKKHFNDTKKYKVGDTVRW